MSYENFLKDLQALQSIQGTNITNMMMQEATVDFEALGPIAFLTLMERTKALA